MDSLDQQKKDARKLAAKRRAEAHAALAASAPGQLAVSGLGFLGTVEAPESARPCVSAFVPYLTEIDTIPLLSVMKAKGWTTALPIVEGDGKPLIFRQWAPGDETVKGAWDIPIPVPEAALVEPDVLLVPMLAFDAAGYRLGYGGGFYDRTLEKLRARKPVIAIGVAYSGQLAERVPRGMHDQPLDWILTEEGAFRPESATVRKG